MILLIFSVNAACSLMFFENFYGYLRNTVMIYSIFSFFLGVKLYHILNRVGSKNLLLLSALIPSSSFYRTSYAASLPLYLSKYTNSCTDSSFLLIIGIMLGVKLYYGGTTSIAVILLLVVLHFLTRRTKIIFYIVMVVLVSVFLIFMKPYFDYLMLDKITVTHIIPQHPFFAIDPNARTRFFIWCYLIFKVFLNNIWGIGLGTTFLSKDFVWTDMQMYIHDPYLDFTLGAHNSFITVLVRFGIIGILPFIMLYYKLVNDIVQYKKKKRGNRIFFFYYAFFIITGCASLNVVLESPMHASLYWGTLGILCEAKQNLTNPIQ